MYRFSQPIQNFFIRLEGLLSQFLGSLFGGLKQLFQFIGRIVGLSSKSQYFLEDEAQRNKPAETQTDIATPQTSPATNATRRRPDANMDYYIKMAQPKKASK